MMGIGTMKIVLQADGQMLQLPVDRSSLKRHVLITYITLPIQHVRTFSHPKGLLAL